MSGSYEAVLQELAKIEDALHDVDLDKQLQRFGNPAHFHEFSEKYKDFSYRINDAVLQAKTAIESPIYVGVVGHYSHGKSSLLNAFLFPPKAKMLLPTGESIVTAMCTLIQFTSGQYGNQYIEVQTSNEERIIDLDEYGTLVSGKRTAQLTDVDHFVLRLSASELASSLFDTMAHKKIELLDTPGLGGPYWKDEESLRQWIREFSMLVLCVKADQINEKTARVVNPFLKQTSKPIIPVITFWDQWRTSSDYKRISDESDAMKMAKEKLAQHFSSVSEAVEENRVIFTSSSNYVNQVPVPTQSTQTISEYWNIDNLRRTVSAYVDARSNILRRNKSSESRLDKTRKDAVISSCKSLRGVYDSLASSMHNVLEKVRPKLEYEIVLDEGIEELGRKLDSEYDKLVERIHSVIEEEIRKIGPRDSYRQEFGNIPDKITKNLKENLSNIRPRIERHVNRGLVDPLTRVIEKDTPLSASEKRRLSKEVRRHVDTFLDHTLDYKEVELFKATSNIGEELMTSAKEVAQTVQKMLLTNPLLVLLIIAPIVVGPTVLLFLTKYIPGFLPVALIGAAVCVLFGVMAFYGSIMTAKEKSCQTAKEKTLDANRPIDIEERLRPYVGDSVQELHDTLKELLSRYLERQTTDTDSMVNDISESMESIEKSLRILEREISSIARGEFNG